MKTKLIYIFVLVISVTVEMYTTKYKEELKAISEIIPKNNRIIIIILKNQNARKSKINNYKQLLAMYSRFQQYITEYKKYKEKIEDLKSRILDAKLFDKYRSLHKSI